MLKCWLWALRWRRYQNPVTRALCWIVAVLNAMLQHATVNITAGVGRRYMWFSFLWQSREPHVFSSCIRKSVKSWDMSNQKWSVLVHLLSKGKLSQWSLTHRNLFCERPWKCSGISAENPTNHSNLLIFCCCSTKKMFCWHTYIGFGNNCHSAQSGSWQAIFIS